MKNYTLFYVTCLVQVSITQSSDFILPNLFEKNGWKNVTISIFGNKTGGDLELLAIRTAKAMAAKTFCVAVTYEEPSQYSYNLILTYKWEDLKGAVILDEWRGVTTVIWLLGETFESETEFEDRLQRHFNKKANTLIYAFTQVNSKFYLILNTPRFTRIVVNEVSLNESLRIHRNRLDLKGQLVTSSNLPFFPYIDFDAEGGSFGLLADVLNIAANEFNFTVANEIQAEGEWGLLPLKNGTYVGILGDLYYDKYDASLSAWKWTYGRYDIMDFTQVYTDSIILALTPRSKKLDLSLFIRPFVRQAWFMIALTGVFFAFALGVPYLVLKGFENSDTNQVISTAGWVFFLLVNAFYGGALTMFFSSSAALPFHTIRGAMQAYPNWILQFLAGNDIYFYPLAAEGDPDYKTYYARVEADRDKYTFPTIEQGLRNIKDSYTVIHINYGILTAAFAKYPDIKMKIETFGRIPNAWDCIALAKHSPLKLYLGTLIAELREDGIIQQLRSLWEGRGIPANPSDPAEVLTLGQTLVAYLIITVAFGTSLAIFVCEKVYKKYNSTEKGWKR